MGAIRVLLLLGFIVKFWWLLVLVLTAVVAGVVVWVGRMHLSYAAERERRARAALVARVRASR